MDKNKENNLKDKLDDITHIIKVKFKQSNFDEFNQWGIVSIEKIIDYFLKKS